jgi:hypothetical protein
MEAKAKRTVVKSAPELWALADDPAKMQAWMADLIGAGEPVAVEVTDRDPGRALAWRCSPGEEAAGGGPRVVLELAESGFGTSVSITALDTDPDPAAALAGLERLLDELGSPERRPFSP